MSPYVKHFPVMSQEVINYVAKDSGGFYVDCTFGAGGHSRKLLEMLGPNARLVALDVDSEAVAIGRQLEKEDPRFTMLQMNFVDLGKWLKENNCPKVDGIIFDLGISMMQIKNPKRGFSYNYDASDLDMRMSKSLRNTAADILNNYKKNELSRIFKRYGDIRNPSKLVNMISNVRKQRSGIFTTGEFRDIVEESFVDTREDLGKYVKKCFQALRIETNDEINILDRTLDSLHEIMNRDGIVCIITFHSLEEEIIHTWRRRFCDVIQIEDYASNVTNKFRFLTGATIVPSESEVSENWSSRSAKLWVAQRN